MKRCLGLDLGSRITGLCVLEGDGRQTRLCLEKTIKLSKKSLGQRLLELVSQISDELHNSRPDVVTLETPFYGIDVKSLSVLCQVRGAVLVELARLSISVLDISPALVKQTVTGYGQAPKDQVARMMQRLLGVGSFSSADASDAAAVAYAGLIMASQKITGEVRK